MDGENRPVNNSRTYMANDECLNTMSYAMLYVRFQAVNVIVLTKSTGDYLLSIAGTNTHKGEHKSLLYKALFLFG